MPLKTKKTSIDKREVIEDLFFGALAGAMIAGTIGSVALLLHYLFMLFHDMDFFTVVKLFEVL